MAKSSENVSIDSPHINKPHVPREKPMKAFGNVPHFVVGVIEIAYVSYKFNGRVQHLERKWWGVLRPSHIGMSHRDES